MPKHNNTSIYPFASIDSRDGLLGFSYKDFRRTKNFKIADLINYIITIIGGGVGNTVLTGDIIWLGDRDYLVYDLSFWLNNTFYNIEDTEVTVGIADSTYSRFDVIYADTDGNIGIEQGVASATPVKPTLDTTTQIEVSFILIEASSSQPVGTSEVLIYTDNLVTDWTNTGFGTITVDFDDVVSPQSGTKSIALDGETLNAGLTFTSANPIAYDPTLALHFYIKFNDATILTEGQSDLRVLFTDANDNLSTAVNAFVDYGVDLDNKSDWQSVVIPLSDLDGLASISNLSFNLDDQAVTSFSIDHIRLVGQNEIIVIQNSFLNLNDTPNTYAGHALKRIAVKANEQELEFVEHLIINNQIVDFIKHPDNDTPANQNTFEAYDFAKDIVKSDMIWNLAQWTGGDQSDDANWNVINYTRLTAIP